MPDVTPKPLRSQANAIINLCGGAGGAIAFIIYTVALMFPLTVNTYTIIFASVAAGMLLLLGGFLTFVKEKKLVAKCQEICKEYGIDDFDEGEEGAKATFAEELIAEGEGNEEEAKALEAKRVKNNINPRKSGGTKNRRRKGQTQIVLAYSRVDIHVVYGIQRNLVKPFGLHHQNAQPVGRRGVHYLGREYGHFRNRVYSRRRARGENRQKKSIMLGFALAVVSFFLIFFFVHAGEKRLSPPYCSRCFILSRASVLSLQTSTRSRWLPNFPPRKPSDNTPDIITPQRCPRKQSPRLSRALSWTTAKRNVVPVQRDLHYHRNRFNDVCQTRRQQTYSQKNKLEQYGDLVDSD